MRFYDTVMVPRMFEPWAGLLLDEIELGTGEALLDVACGPGSVTRLAAARVGRKGRVLGCDLSPAMLEIARGKPPIEGGAAIEYHEASADDLAADDEAFDVVTCQQGLQFFPDRAVALTEMRRALRPGGRVGIAVWAEIEQCPPFSATADAIESTAGSDVAERFRGGPWGFPDARRLRGLIDRAGFVDVQVVRRSLPVTFEGGAAQLATTLAATPVGPDIQQLSDEGRDRLVALLTERLGQGAVVAELTSNVAVARRA